MKYKKTAWKDLIAKGDHRIDKLQREIRVRLQGTPNLLIFPHYGKGTGTDIVVVFKGNEILELHEVTNWQKFAKNGKPIFMSDEKAEQYMKSLTQKVYWLYWMNSKKRFYPTPQTKRYMHVSYESNLQQGQRQYFQSHGIEIKVWSKTTFPIGYTVEDDKGNKKAFYEDGTEVEI